MESIQSIVDQFCTLLSIFKVKTVHVLQLIATILINFNTWFEWRSTRLYLYLFVTRNFDPFEFVLTRDILKSCSLPPLLFNCFHSKRPVLKLPWRKHIHLQLQCFEQKLPMHCNGLGIKAPANYSLSLWNRFDSKKGILKQYTCNMIAMHNAEVAKGLSI